ncbi:UNVERIFIED_CONTAM: hypothetical protein Sradi_3608900 [Sesamum radiatum]|uniref:Uncharacterized protein n=1 Tax=Sesamum radiatum TaxID=300843 RepID=A0AAW2QH55_SESRA
MIAIPSRWQFLNHHFASLDLYPVPDFRVTYDFMCAFFSCRYLPPEIGCLNNLEYLGLSFNKMRNLPDEITSLNLLIQLRVTNNKLIDLHLRLSCLQRLEILDLSNNRLTSLEYSELESMHNLRILNLQHNQLRGCGTPSWICCNLGGNVSDLSNDESAEIDVYGGVIQEIHAARRGDEWKCRYNLQAKARQEQLNSCRKLKVDAATESSSERCMTCRVSGHSVNASSKDLSVVPDEKLIIEDLSPECEVQGNSVTVPGSEDFGPVKESVNTCSCPAIDSDRKHKEIGSNAALGSPSDAVEIIYPMASMMQDEIVPLCHWVAMRKNCMLTCGKFLLDRERNEELDAILLRARAFLHQFKHFNKSNDHKEVALDSLLMASLLALFVLDHFGGSDKSAVTQRTRKAVSGSNYMKPFVCTCATGIIDDTSKATRHV